MATLPPPPPSSHHPPNPHHAPPPPTAQAPPPPREPHLVSLKVLRAARPSLVPTSAPYYEPTSLGAAALDAVDRDTLPGRAEGGGLSGVLMLPSTFGTIYLGETFSALLCLSNDLRAPPSAATTAISPQLKIEMLTPSQQKHQLTPTSAPTTTPPALQPGGSMELLVQHEVNEMGTHALECTVTYGVRVAGEDGREKVVGRSFRKVYRFQVSNPLKVKTKAHSPTATSPTTYLDKAERGKVFLEVLLENLCESAMSFSRVSFDPTPDWTHTDANLLPTADPSAPSTSLFSGDATLLPPGAVRQYLFVCTPTPTATPALPGASQALGRLDIAWRTPNGEPGRLQTAMLGRRVPVPIPGAGQVVGPAPAVPEKALPSLADSVGSSATLGSPSKGPAPYRPHQQAVAQPLPPRTPHQPDATELEFDLTLSSLQPAQAAVDRPFTLTFNLDVRDKSTAPTTRHLKLVAQHVQWLPTAVQMSPPESTAEVAARTPLVTLAVPGAAPLQAAPAGTTSLQQQQLRRLENSSVLSSRGSMDSLRSVATNGLADLAFDPVAAVGPAPVFNGVALPRPTPIAPPNPALPAPSRQVVRLGPSTVALPEVMVAAGGEVASVQFKMRFLALEPGFARVGGLRLLLVSASAEAGTGEAVEDGRERLARVVWEQGVVAEVMVGSA